MPRGEEGRRSVDTHSADEARRLFRSPAGSAAGCSSVAKPSRSTHSDRDRSLATVVVLRAGADAVRGGGAATLSRRPPGNVDGGGGGSGGGGGDDDNGDWPPSRCWWCWW